MKLFLNKLLKYIFKEPVKVHDHFFGEMIDAGDYYECRRPFEPTNKIVDIGLKKIDSSKDAQITFFKWIESEYDLIISKISPALENRVATWIKNYYIQDFKSEYVLEYVFIPECNDEIFEWELSFFAVNDLQHWCSLQMKGLEVMSIQIDG